VLWLSLPMAFDPVCLGVNLLLISRPRRANLLVYWVGCVIASVVVPLTPLMVLPSSQNFALGRNSASHLVQVNAAVIGPRIGPRMFAETPKNPPARRVRTYIVTE
jgi:hypothetical protein